MEHERCGRCRNPVRGRQASVRHARVGVVFHLDCWGVLHDEAQQAYVHRIEEQGLPALLSPYTRTEATAWLTEPPDDLSAAAEHRLAG